MADEGRQYEWFVRRVVDVLGRYEDHGAVSLSAEDKVGQAQRFTDAFIETGDFPLNEDSAVSVAAIVVAFNRRERETS